MRQRGLMNMLTIIIYWPPFWNKVYAWILTRRELREPPLFKVVLSATRDRLCNICIFELSSESMSVKCNLCRSLLSARQNIKSSRWFQKQQHQQTKNSRRRQTDPPVCALLQHCANAVPCGPFCGAQMWINIDVEFFHEKPNAKVRVGNGKSVKLYPRHFPFLWKFHAVRVFVWDSSHPKKSF